MSHLELVIDRFNAMLAGMGAVVEPVGVENGTLTLQYQEGVAGQDCEACVLEPDDLEALIDEAVVGKVDGVQRVTVLR